MAWWSILPPHLTAIETWIIRFFLFVGTLMIAPWIIFLVYDLLLYIFRAVTYEIPYVGGKARGRQRPRAPSLAERPNGRRRNFSLGAIGTSSGVTGSDDQEVRRGHRKSRSSGGRKRPNWESDEGGLGDSGVLVED